MIEGTHFHNDRSHAHACPDVIHHHLLRAVCQLHECENYPTHDIHVSTPKERTP